MGRMYGNRELGGEPGSLLLCIIAKSCSGSHMNSCLRILESRKRQDSLCCFLQDNFITQKYCTILKSLAHFQLTFVFSE